MKQQQTILLLLLVVGAVVGGYFWWRKQEDDKTKKAAAAAEEAAKAAAAAATAAAAAEATRQKAAKEAAAEKKRIEEEEAKRKKDEEDAKNPPVPTPTPPTPGPPGPPVVVQPWLVADLANSVGILTAVTSQERLRFVETSQRTDFGNKNAVVRFVPANANVQPTPLRFVATSAPGVYYLKSEKEPNRFVIGGKNGFETHEPLEAVPPFPFKQPEAWRPIPLVDARQFKMENYTTRTLMSLAGQEPTTFEFQPLPTD